MNRNTIFIVGIALGTLLVAGGIFLFIWLGSRGQTAPGSEGEGFLGGFFGNRVSQEGEGQRGGGEGLGNEVSLESLFLIHEKPIAGFVLFPRNDALYARFVEQETGHVYEFSFVTGEKTRVTNTTIPAVQEALWAKDGGAALFQYLEGDEMVRSALGLLPATTTGSFSSISFLEEGAYAPSFSPSGKEVFYLHKGGSGTEGFTMTREGRARKLVFSSPLTEWKSVWGGETDLYIIQRPGLGGGLAYRVNPKSGTRVELSLGSPIADLLPSGARAIASPLSGNDFGNVSVYERGSLGAPLLPTIPEKCGWVDGQALLYCATPTTESIPLVGRVAAWYRGEFFTTDEVYRLTATGTPAIIGKDAISPRGFDIVSLSVSPTEEFLAFKNKKDGLLWGYRLK